MTQPTLSENASSTPIKTWFLNHYGFDFRSFALFRVGLAVMYLVDMIDRSRDIEAFYTDEGVLPRFEFFNENHPFMFSWHLLQGSAPFQALLFAIGILFGICFLVGYKTKWMNFLCWTFLYSFQSRLIMLTHGGDMLLSNLMFLALFSPLGHRYSVDAALQTDSQNFSQDLAQNPSRNDNSQKSSPQNLFFSMGGLLLFVQIAIMYGYTALFKQNPEWLEAGTALYYALNIHFVTAPLGQLLLPYPDILTALTFASILFEMYGFAFFIIPFYTGWFRILGVFSYIAFHLGIAATMNIGIFPWVDCIAVLFLLPSMFWDKLLEKLQHPLPNMVLTYQGDNPNAQRFFPIFKTFFLLSNVSLQTHQNPTLPLWFIETEENLHPITGEEAWTLLFKGSPLLKFMSFLAHSKPFTQFLDNGLQKKECCLLPYFPLSPKPKTSPLWKPVLANAISLFFCFYITQYAQADYKQERPWFQELGLSLNLPQHWIMFGQPSVYTNGWSYSTGTLTSNQTVNLLPWLFERKETPEIANITPNSSFDVYPDDRWMFYFMTLSHVNDATTQRRFGFLSNYLCRTWNQAHQSPTEPKLKKVEIGYYLRQTPPVGEAFQPAQRNSYFVGSCF
ncbi:MAG: HTTM domain-containing protein [Cyanobacteria bacterium]|nr:HTTM domain-containing protein [Cyanobacteriota bacterium]